MSRTPQQWLIQRSLGYRDHHSLRTPRVLCSNLQVSCQFDSVAPSSRAQCLLLCSSPLQEAFVPTLATPCPLTFSLSVCPMLHCTGLPFCNDITVSESPFKRQSSLLAALQQPFAQGPSLLPWPCHTPSNRCQTPGACAPMSQSPSSPAAPYNDILLAPHSRFAQFLKSR